MNILITGSNGFLAKNIISNFENHNFYKISRKELDLTNKNSVNDFFRDKQFDIVINTAVVGGRRLIEDSKDVFYDNLMICMNLVHNRTHFKKLIHFGSGAELDRSGEISNNSKNIFDCLPVDPYGLSKNIIARLYSDYENFYNLRIFNVFTHNEEKNRMIANSINNYINKNPIIIHQDRYMDFIYMNDFLKILDLYINNDNLPNSVDCVYDDKYKLSDIAHLINKLSDYRVDIDVLNKKLGHSYCGNKIDLGLKFDGLEMGLKNTYSGILQDLK